MDVTPIIVAGASFAVVAAIACALLAVAILVVTVRSREGSGSGIGCALLGLMWAGANAGLAYFIAWVSCALIALGIHGVASGGTTTFVKDPGSPGQGR